MSRVPVNRQPDTDTFPLFDSRTTNIALLCDQNTEKNLVVLGEQGALAIYVST